MIAALDVHGTRRHSFVDGGVKGVDFLHFVRELLGPSFRPGKVVVMDNLRPHNSPEVLDYLQQRQCRVVFVPPYRLDANPIEMAFSKVKHHGRKAFAQSTRTLREAFDAASATIRPRDARNYIRHTGYY